MDITIYPRQLAGQVVLPPSKSIAHRILICAALADGPTQINCPTSNRDISATINCLNALGATITATKTGFSVIPMDRTVTEAQLFCGESGATLRFLLPLVGALGVDATFHLEGRLPQRPLSPLWEEMERMGCTLSRPTDHTIRCKGKLMPGQYNMDCNVSSQFVSGLLFALSLLPDSDLQIRGRVQSAPYICMTKDVLLQFDAPRFHTPGHVTVECDWSSGAFWAAAKHLGCTQLSMLGTKPGLTQGDYQIISFLHLLDNSRGIISAADHPDLFPIMSIVAAAKHGAIFKDTERLRYKESDRIASTVAMLNSLGIQTKVTDCTFTVYPGTLMGGTVDSFHDHRIAMSAAIAAIVCQEPVTILHAECVEKSYPGFWDDYLKLGGKYDQFLR